MKCRFWGVRGSIPTPLKTDEIKEKTRKVLLGARGVDLGDAVAVDDYLRSIPDYEIGSVGGNSSCVEVRAGDNLLIFDAGSGLRELGLSLMRGDFGKGAGAAHIFLSHTHWDHIMGIPFFVPAYLKGNSINFYGGHDRLEERIRAQQDPEHFPVSMDMMAASFSFNRLQPGGRYDISDVTVIPFIMNHPGVTFGYRVEFLNRSFVYASDTEFTEMSDEHTRFLKNADVLVLDTMYTFDDVIEKMDWGHCTPMIGIDLALRENVGKLVLFHHEPTYSDEKLVRLWKKAVDYKKKMAPGSDLEVILAREGLEIDLNG